MGLSRQEMASLAASDPEPVALYGLAGAQSVMEDVRLTGQSFSSHYQTADALRQSYQALADRGYEMPPLPPVITGGVADAALAFLDGRKDDVGAARSADLGPVDARLQTGEEIRQSVQKRVTEARARAERAGLGASLVGSLAAGVEDPVNLALIPLGAGVGTTVLRSMGIEAALGVVSQGVIEAASFGAKQRGGVTPSAGEVAANVALTGAFAGALPGVFHGAGLAARRLGLLSDYRAKVKAGTVKPTAASEAAADAVQDVVDTVPPLGSPTAEAAHLDAVVAASDVLRAETPEARASALARYHDLENEAMVQDAIARGVYDPNAAPEPRVAAESPTARIEVPPAPEPPTASAVLASMEREMADLDARAAAVREAPAKPGDTLLAEIRRRGGIDPASLRRMDGFRNLTENGLLTVAKRGALGVDQWHETAIEEGLIPAGTTLDEFFGMLTGKARTLEAEERVMGQADAALADAESLRSHVAAYAEATKTLREINGGREPLAADVDEYVVDPGGYLARYERAAADGRIAENGSISPEALRDSDPGSATFDPGAWDFNDPVELSAFQSNIEANPDLSAHYTSPDGEIVSGRATDLIADLEEQRTTMRQILDCVLAGGPAE